MWSRLDNSKCLLAGPSKEDGFNSFRVHERAWVQATWYSSSLTFILWTLTLWHCFHIRHQWSCNVSISMRLAGDDTFFSCSPLLLFYPGSCKWAFFQISFSLFLTAAASPVFRDAECVHTSASGALSQIPCRVSKGCMCSEFSQACRCVIKSTITVEVE